jgi:hypothetical protein
MHVRELLRDLDRRVHVAERRREDQLMSRLRKLAYHALGVGAFRHAFDELRRDLCTESLFHREARDVVLVRPARVTDRAHVDEANFKRRGCLRRSGERQRDAARRERRQGHSAR